MKLPLRDLPRWDNRGSVLLEVVVAALLVGILVGPLAAGFSRAVGQAQTVRERIEEGVAGAQAATSVSSWGWGPKVLTAWWRPGPVLHVRVATSDRLPEQRQDTRVGLWVEGWLLAEEAITLDENGGPAGDEVEIGPERWTALADGALIVRVRAEQGPWGPPWRLAVPGPAAGTPVLGSILASSSQTLPYMVHRPGNGTSSLAASWSAAPLTSPPFGLLFSLAPGLQGWGGATLDDRSQWWWMEEGRSLDVYF